MNEVRKFKRVLVANRGEIAIRIFRACKELGIRSVAIYSEEDKNTLFRIKADESYQIGKGKAPVDAYLAMDEIIELAKSKGIEAIHPGYGFLAENTAFARACEAAGIVFIGPDYDMMDNLGDKVKSKIIANSVGVPTIPGNTPSTCRKSAPPWHGWAACRPTAGPTAFPGRIWTPFCANTWAWGWTTRPGEAWSGLISRRRAVTSIPAATATGAPGPSATAARWGTKYGFSTRRGPITWICSPA